MALRSALQRVTAPLTKANGRLYAWANVRSSEFLAKFGPSDATAPPKWWLTANGITTARSTLVVPTLALFSNGYSMAPAALVVVNVTFDYVDGAVARWERQRAKANPVPVDPSAPQPSARTARVNDTFGAYYDAIADKAFAIPVWLCCFQNFPEHPLLQAALLSHVTIEGYSSFIRTKAYFREPAPIHWAQQAVNAPVNSTKVSPVETNGDVAKIPAPEAAPIIQVQNSGQSAVVAGIVGKTKQFLAMLGTAMVMVPVTQTAGTALLCVSVPLALASVVQKTSSTRVYAELTANSTAGLNAETMEFIEQSKSLGSSLLVGVRSGDVAETAPEYSTFFKAVQLHPSVDHVLPCSALPAPGKFVDGAFLQRHNVNVVAVPSSSTFDDLHAEPERWRSGRIVPVPCNVSEYA